jgi:phospholipid-binding lipoprotein MlaA
VPRPARTGVKNVLRNLKSPVRFTNQLLQGDVSGAGNELFRTVVNTFVGAGGLFDVAAYEGYAYEHEDFGQTLGVWGVPNGAYVVVPFLGPSSMRDYAGYAVDTFADPLNMYLRNTNQDEWLYARLGAEYFTVRDGLYDVLNDLEASSIDYYAAIRSTYYQNREALIRDRGTSAMSTPAIPDFDDENYDDQYFE